MTDVPPATDSDPRRTRRGLLAGAVGGAVVLAADAGISALRGPETARGGAPADLPFFVGRPTGELPQGLVRADLRAFKRGTASDWHDAFAAALDVAAAVYVPPGEWSVARPVSVGTNKVLFSDGTYDRGDAADDGAVIRSSARMRATVLMDGDAACLWGVNVDGTDLADSAVEFAADSLLLNGATARRGVQYALKATGNFCTIWGGLFQQAGGRGYSLYQRGSDILLWGSRIKRGRVPLWVDGSGGILGTMHVTGKTEPGSPSSTCVRVTGPRNQFVNVYYDSSVGPSVLLEGGAVGNRFLGMTFRNSGSDRTFPVIRCDGRAGFVRKNLFDGFNTDRGSGTGWNYLVEILGDPSSVRGNALGSGYADDCADLWNVRPALVGEVWSDGLLTRNAGNAAVAAGAISLSITHGLKGTPRSVSIDLSKGGAARPDIQLTTTLIVLTWSNPPGGLTAYWRAEL